MGVFYGILVHVSIPLLFLFLNPNHSGFADFFHFGAPPLGGVGCVSSSFPLTFLSFCRISSDLRGYILQYSEDGVAIICLRRGAF